MVKKKKKIVVVTVFFGVKEKSYVFLETASYLPAFTVTVLYSINYFTSLFNNMACWIRNDKTNSATHLTLVIT